MRRLTAIPACESPALERGVALLRCLDFPFGSAGALPAELQKKLGLPRVAVFRLLKVLTEAELVVQDSHTGRYVLGPGLMELGYYAAKANPFFGLARPILLEIARTTGQTSQILIPHGRWGTLEFDLYHRADASWNYDFRPGRYVPIQHRNAHGLCFLAFSDERRIEEYRRLTSTKDGVIEFWLDKPPPGDLLQRCARQRSMGYVAMRDVMVGYIANVAVPVFGRPPRLVASLGVACAPGELTQSRIREWGKYLQVKARQLGRKYRDLHEG